jgi:hypothetical protein
LKPLRAAAFDTAGIFLSHLAPFVNPDGFIDAGCAM